MLKADLTFKEVPAPLQNWCKSGHFAPAKFRREGPTAKEEVTKFYQASYSDPNVNGVYCEICVILANALSRGEIKPSHT